MRRRFPLLIRGRVSKQEEQGSKPIVMASNQQLSMKLLIDTQSHRVLFAEAGKDAVDFLFSLLAMPVGTIVKLLTKDHMVGCLGSLYQSVESLDDTYLLPNHNKSVILSPQVSSISASQNPLLLPEPPQAKSYYRCDYCSNYFTDVSGTECPGCRKSSGCHRCMTTMINYVDVDPKSGKVVEPNVGEVGYVKGVVTYSVMDDLTVTPMSTISSITLLNKFQVKDVRTLEEKTVKLGLEEGLALLKASLQSKTVLTDVFLGKKKSGVVLRR